MRRKVAILLTVCLLIGLVPMSAWAETENVKAAKAEEIVNVMTELKDYVFAYGLRGDVSTDEEKAECLKNSMAEELTEKRIGYDCSLGEAFGEIENPVSSDTLKSYIKVGTASEATDSETGLYYFDYEIKIPQAVAGTSEDVVTVGRVYILDSITDVLVKTVESGKPVFTVLKQELYKEKGTNDYFEYPRFMYSDVDTYEDDHDHRLPDMEVYGNGVVANVLESEDENVYGFQIVQEHCGNLVPQGATPSQTIGGTLILSKNEDAVRFSYKEDAAAWNFSDVKTFVPTADEKYPPIAQVFYGVGSLTVEAADFQNRESERTITDIEVQGNLSKVFGVKKDDGKWIINLESSYYDVVPLRFTYNDGPDSFLTINKVGVKL